MGCQRVLDLIGDRGAAKLSDEAQLCVDIGFQSDGEGFDRAVSVGGGWAAGAVLGCRHGNLLGVV